MITKNANFWAPIPEILIQFVGVESGTIQVILIQGQGSSLLIKAVIKEQKLAKHLSAK